jgi:hypothetical protein
VQFSPDASGRFYIELPNLAVDPVSNRYRNPAELRLSAQDKASYDRYWLTPPNATKKGMMQIKSGDTVEMVFVAEKIQQGGIYAVYRPIACFTLSHVSRAIGVTRSAPSCKTRAM